MRCSGRCSTSTSTRRSSATPSASRPRRGSRPHTASTTSKDYIAYGASPRGPISLVQASRALALVRGRDYVLADDLHALAKDALRHRLVLTYQALAEEVTPDDDPRHGARRRSRSEDRPRAARARRERRCVSSTAEPTPARPGPGAAPGCAAARARRQHRAADGRPARGRLPLDAPRRRDRARAGPSLRSGDDDVRRIDWNVTARTGEPHVRVHLAERVLVTWLVLDTSASMQFGTADRRKADVAEGVAIAVGHIATRRGNRLGLVTFGDDSPRAFPPRQGRHGLLGLLSTLAGRAGGGERGATSLGEALHRTAALARQRAAVIVVSDFRGPLDWRRPLLELAGTPRRGCGRDPRPPRAGAAERRRALAGRPGDRDGSSASTRAASGCGAASPRRLRRSARSWRVTLASAGARHVVLTTAGDWLRSLAVFLREDPPVSFESPLALLALVLVPVLVALYVAARTAPARSYAARFTTPGLLPNLVDATPGWRETSAARAFARRARRDDRRRRAAARKRERPREEATVLIAIDTSLLDERARHPAVAARSRRRRAAQAFVDGDAEEVPRRRRSAFSRTRVRRSRRRPTDRELVRSARSAVAQVRRGHGDRRRGGARRRLAARSANAATAAIPPTAMLVISDGAPR